MITSAARVKMRYFLASGQFKILLDYSRERNRFLALGLEKIGLDKINEKTAVQTNLFLSTIPMNNLKDSLDVEN